MDTGRVIRECVNLILAGVDAEVIEGWTRLRKLEADSTAWQLSNHETVLRDALNGQVLNVHQVPELLTWFGGYLTERTFEMSPITNDVAGMLRNAEILEMLHLTRILQALSEQKVYLPETASHSKLCEAVIVCLSTFPMPYDSKKILEYKENVVRIQNFLKTLCANARNAESDNLIFICLQTLYRLISDTKRKQDPAPGLAAVLQLGEPAVIPQAVNWILSKSHYDCELAQALKVLCIWLTKWPDDRLSIWIMEFIQGLERKHKYSILFDVTKEILDVMFCALSLPIFRKNASTIILHVLKRQGSPVLVQNIVKNIPTVFFCLTKEDSESSRECIQNLVDVMKVIMLRFSGYYAYTNLQNCFPVQPCMDVVYEMRNEPVWIDETKQFKPVLESPPKTHIDKVGLSNLGNTCYMNSVLQALLMTRQFCYEVLTYKSSSAHNEQVILKKLQNLFTLLLYSKRISLAPTEILLVSRPAYFLPGQQQDSSEFLCHLLDLLHEQAKSANSNCGSNDTTTNFKCKEKEANGVSGTHEPGGIIKRWITEEDLTEGTALQRKTQSLADFTQGEDLAQVQLTDSHSDSIDSGIQLVGGEETSPAVSIVHKVLGGESKITYQCAQCDTNSHHTDRFRDLQLCFPEEIQENQEVSVQDLINYSLTPEKLTGENKYRCDKCTKLCDAQRIIKILQAPAHLILILKHFRYDFESGLRTKLRHKVVCNETIKLPVSAELETIVETYQLYAAVVHSGYSMDYGHYFTYACDSKQNWYKFNDSYVSETTLTEFKQLKSPDTPYILFYQKCAATDKVYDEKPDLSSLSKDLQELVANDTTAYIEELRHEAEKSQRGRHSPMFLRKNENSDDENPPPSSCRGAVNMPANRFLY